VWCALFHTTKQAGGSDNSGGQDLCSCAEITDEIPQTVWHCLVIMLPNTTSGATKEFLNSRTEVNVEHRQMLGAFRMQQDFK